MFKIQLWQRNQEGKMTFVTQIQEFHTRKSALLRIKALDVSLAKIVHPNGDRELWQSEGQQK